MEWKTGVERGVIEWKMCVTKKKNKKQTWLVLLQNKNQTITVGLFGEGHWCKLLLSNVRIQQKSEPCWVKLRDFSIPSAWGLL